MGEVEEGKLCAILAWLFPIGLIWFFADDKMRKNKFVAFHVKQSLVLVIASVIINVLGLIPFLGWFIIMPVGDLIIFIFFLMGIINAANGKEKKLPWIGSFGEKFTF